MVFFRTLIPAIKKKIDGTETHLLAGFFLQNIEVIKGKIEI